MGSDSEWTKLIGFMPPPGSGRGYIMPSHKAIRQAFKNNEKGISNSQHFADLRSKIARPLGFDTLGAFCDTQFKFDLEFPVLMMKKEDIWMPLMVDIGFASIGTLYGIGRTLKYDLGSICKHLEWDEEYYFLVPQMEKFPLEIARIGKEKEQAAVHTFSIPAGDLPDDGRPICNAQAKVSKKLQCALFHELGCQCPDSTHWGAVKSCPRCFTDYAFSVASVPSTCVKHKGNDRFFVFSSWKHVGGAEKDRFWKSHTDKGNAMLRSQEPGWSYVRYEVGSSGGAGQQLCNYVPQARSSFGGWDTYF